MCVGENVRMKALLCYFQRGLVRFIFSKSLQGSSVNKGWKQTFTIFHNI